MEDHIIFSYKYFAILIHFIIGSIEKMVTTFGLVLSCVVVAVAASVKLLNWMWFRPRKLEKFLRKQGVKGNSYRPVVGDLKDFIRASRAEQPKFIQLSDNIVPHIFPYHNAYLSNYGKW